MYCTTFSYNTAQKPDDIHKRGKKECLQKERGKTKTVRDISGTGCKNYFPLWGGGGGDTPLLRPGPHAKLSPAIYNICTSTAPLLQGFPCFGGGGGGGG
jgi:hypothetical protein